MLEKIKSYILTKLFIDWVKNEWDIDTLVQTKILIQQRETELKGMVDMATRKVIVGFKQNTIQ